MDDVMGHRGKPALGTVRVMDVTRVAAVMAAYNRRDLTLACLQSLEAQQAPGVKLDVFVLDDASARPSAWTLHDLAGHRRRGRRCRALRGAVG
jgi:GT2 family glycosyltransferase